MSADVQSTKPIFYVYVLFRESGAPFYIGKGKGDRWEQHERGARRGVKGHKYSIIRNMQSRGVDVPKVKLHHGLTEAAALAYERALISAIGIGKIGPLVNLRESAGRPAGLKHTAEAIARMSAIKRGKKHSAKARANMKASILARGAKPSPECIAAATAAKLGKKHTPERIANHAAKIRGRKHSPESCAKISASNTGQKRSPETCENIGAARRGKTLSPQHKASLSAVRTGKKQSPETCAKRTATWRAKAEQRRAEAARIAA